MIECETRSKLIENCYSQSIFIWKRNDKIDINPGKQYTKCWKLVKQMHKIFNEHSLQSNMYEKLIKMKYRFDFRSYGLAAEMQTHVDILNIRCAKYMHPNNNNTDYTVVAVIVCYKFILLFSCHNYFSYWVLEVNQKSRSQRIRSR